MMETVTLTTETLGAVIGEIGPLLRKHYEEIAWKKDKIAFDPDLERYRALEEAGALRIYIAREAGAMIGYAVFFVGQNMHYRGTKQAVNDIFYVDKSRRGVMLGQKLLRDYAESELKLEGVQIIVLHIKREHDWHTLAEHWGYEWTEYNMQKWIGG